MILVALATVAILLTLGAIMAAISWVDDLRRQRREAAKDLEDAMGRRYHSTLPACIASVSVLLEMRGHMLTDEHRELAEEWLERQESALH
jgi:Na+/pantothenate symporter